MDRSPLAPDGFPAMPPVAGVRVAGAACGLKRSGAKDLFLAELAEGTAVAGVLTQSLCAAAPVDWCRRILPQGQGRAIVVNSGNANAFTGNAGDKTVGATAAAASALFGCAEEHVYLASTGVIGVPVPPTHIGDKLPALAEKLSADAWQDAAEAIMTTDTFPKGATARAEIGGKPVAINGIAKGSGMIAPDMATMLGFVFTDAAIPGPVLQALLSDANQRSFNAITVDGDTSTSDTVLFCATGAAGNAPSTAADDPALADFRRALDAVMTDLAHQIVRDGEGASKFVTVEVRGAENDAAARRIGLSIANSPLVKTAIAGEDANWGRIVMAVGKAGERADRDKLSVEIGGVQITRDGQLVPGYDETPVAQHMKGQEIDLSVDVGIARGKATVWTCDLTHGYISINADYRS